MGELGTLGELFEILLIILTFGFGTVAVFIVFILVIPNIYRTMLRDRFAQTVMLGLLSDIHREKLIPKRVLANEAYKIADEMLVFREVKN